MAKTYYYYKALRKTIIQFLDLFNDIQIARYNIDGSFLKHATVPLKYGPKEKIWYWLHERKDDEMLPVMAVTLQGVNYDAQRMTNKNRYIIETTSASAGAIQRYLNPSPYNLEFQLGVWSLYMNDIDQILEQILPWFQPYAYIRVYIPELFSSWQSKVIFSSVSPDFEFEYSDELHRVLKYTLDFTVQTYLFKPIESKGLVKKIFMNYYTNESGFATRSLTSTFTSGASGESQRFTGVEPWDIDNPMMEYEVFQLGQKTGGTIIRDP